MSPTTDRQYFTTALGWIALAAVAVIFGQFVVSFRFESFWTFKWIISVVFVLGLFGAGVGLLKLGGSRRSAMYSIIGFGLAFMLASIILYCLWGYYHSAGNLSFAHYSGFLVLFGSVVAVAVACIAAISREYLRFASYGFGMVDALYLLLLVKKYVFGSTPFHWATFLGEFVVLAVGAVLFLALFFGSEESRQPAVRS